MCLFLKSFFFFLFYIFLTVVNIGKYFFPLFVLRIWFYNYFYFLLLDLVLFFCCFFFLLCKEGVDIKSNLTYYVFELPESDKWAFPT